jgi:Domain of unknown function (DUF4190)
MITPGAKFCPACGSPSGLSTAATDALPGYLPVPEKQPGAQLPAAAPPKSTNGLAIASMVLGILWVYWIGSILALIFGYVAKGQIDAAGGTQGGRGMAIAGIVLGWVGIGVLMLGIVALAVGS